MKWLRNNARDLGTLFLCIVVILVIIALIGGYGYCAITYGGKPITDIPSICVSVMVK